VSREDYLREGSDWADYIHPDDRPRVVAESEASVANAWRVRPAASVDRFVSWLEHSLDQAAEANPNPGRVALHRLNRAEYAAAVEDLLGLHIDASVFLASAAAEN
jgi:hypothetical protein